MISSSQSQDAPRAKILVGTPCYGGMCFVGYVASLMTSKEYLRTKNIQLETCFLTNESLIPRGRNTIVAKFMNDPSFTHLLFIDGDITWNHLTIERLLNHDKDLVGALYPKKGYTWSKLKGCKDLITDDFDEKAQAEVKARLMNYTVNYTEDRQVVNGCLKVKHIGTGFFLCKREVIQKMMDKYQELKYDDDINILTESENKWLYALFDCEVHRLGPKLHYLSEDYLFCKRWQDMGGDIYADVTIPLTHTGTHSFVGNYLRSIRFEPSRATEEAQPQAVTTGVPVPQPSPTPTQEPVPTPTPTPTSKTPLLSDYDGKEQAESVKMSITPSKGEQSKGSRAPVPPGARLSPSDVGKIQTQ